MRLNDLDRKNTATKALKANFDFDFDTSKLDRATTRDMIYRIKSLIKEAKSNPSYYNQNNPNYMKLMFMAQALTEHYSTFKNARIIYENEQVDKSETILAAQDIIDSVQKMIEQVNDMLVKELPALTDSIQSEIGVNESTTFNQAASEALTSLNQTLSQSKQTLQNAMNQMTGVGNAGAFGAAPTGGEEMAVTDIATASGPGGAEIGAEMDMAELPPEGGELPAPPAAPEVPEEPPSKVGRSKR